MFYFVELIFPVQVEMLRMDVRVDFSRNPARVEFKRDGLKFYCSSMLL